VIHRRSYSAEDGGAGGVSGGAMLGSADPRRATEAVSIV